MLSNSSSGCRPVLRLAPTPLERWLDLLAWLALLIILGLVAWGLLRLPAIIPVHYSLDGPIHADASGSKWILPLFLLLALAVHALLTSFSQRPHRFSYPVVITLQNAERQYRLGLRLLAWLRLSISLLFVYLSWMFIQGAVSGLNSWIFLGFILFALLPLFLVIVYFFNAVRLR
jgi:hypothetical protein